MSRLPEATSYPASMPVHDVALWPSMGRWTLAALVALGVWTATALFSPAQANGVNWSLGVHVPGGAIVVGEHRPVAVYANPVYPAVAYSAYPSYPVYPTPVYAPPARVYAPAPWGYGPHRGYVPPPPHRHHHGYRNEHHPDPYAYGGGRHGGDGRGGRGDWDRR